MSLSLSLSLSSASAAKVVPQTHSLQLATEQHSVSSLRVVEVSSQVKPLTAVPHKAAPSADKNTDDMLVARVQEGDKKAFDLLVLRHQSSVARVVMMTVKDRNSVPDIVQEVFIRVYKAINRFRFESQFYTWLYRIAVNTSFNHLGALRRKPASVDVDDAHYATQVAEATRVPGPDKELHRMDLKSALEKAISRLPNDLRTALLLRDKDGMSYEQIAEIFDCPVGTVRSRISRAREHVMNRTKNLYKAEPV